MKCGEHMVHMEEGRVHTVFWWGHLRERFHLKGAGVSEWIILQRMFKK